MQDLQEVTQDLHYENFRSERLKRGSRLSSHGYMLLLPLLNLYFAFSVSHLPLHLDLVDQGQLCNSRQHQVLSTSLQRV